MFSKHSSEDGSVLDQCEMVALGLVSGDVVFAGLRVWG